MMYHRKPVAMETRITQAVQRRDISLLLALLNDASVTDDVWDAAIHRAVIAHHCRIPN